MKVIMNFGQISAERWRLINWILLTVILLIGAFLRFYNLSYAIGTHPDERHMVSVTLDLKPEDMNPKSFAYGSLNYYLVWVFSEAVGYFWPYFKSYDGIFMVGRTVCAIFGLITVLLTYLIAKQLYQNKLVALVAASLLSFNFFHIQLSRYFTSDVLLTMICLATLCSLLAYEQSTKLRYAALTGIFIGAALATKISGIFLSVPLGITFVFLVFVSRKLTLSKAFAVIALVTFISLGAAFVFEPYAVLDFNQFWRDTQEQTNMARGQWRPPYTIQYARTTPYLYHLSQMFHFTIGWPVFLAIICGLGLTFFDCYRQSSQRFWIVLSWIAVFFLATAGLQVKFPRYLLPLYPLLFVFGAAALTRLLYTAEVRSPSYYGGSTYGTQFPHYSLPTWNWTSKLNVVRNFACSQVWVMPLFIALSLGGLIASILIPAQWFYSVLLAWISAWFFGTAAFFVFDWKKNTASRTELVEWTSLECLTVVSLLVIAFVARIVFLTDLPMLLHNDEMSCGLAARNFYRDTTPALFSFGWLSHPQLGFFITSLFMRILGDDLFGLRMSSVVLGLFSLLGTYLLVRLLFNRMIALILLALSACYHWHIHFSRTGFHNMLALSVSVWAIYCFVLAWNKRSYGLAAAAGTLMGIAVQTYNLAYMVPVILTAWALLGVLFEEQRFKWALNSLGLLFGFCLITGAPLIVFLLNSAEPFGARAHDVFIFAQNNKEHVGSAAGTYETLPILLYQLKKVGMFFWSAHDSSVQYGFTGRYVDLIVWAPFIVGIFYCLWSIKHRGAQLLLIWLGVVVVAGGVLTIDPPFSPRLLGIASIILCFAAITLSKIMTWCLEGGAQYRRFGFEFCLLLIAASMFWNLYTYFETYPDQVGGERRDRIARLLEAEPRIQTVLNVFPQPENFEYESYQFMAPHTRGVNLNSLSALTNGSAYNPIDTAIVAPVSAVRMSEMLPPQMQIAQQKVITDSSNPEGFQWILVKPK